MTLQECRDSVGCKVVYNKDHSKPEYGVIISVNDLYAFVRYGTSYGAQATRPQDLTLDC